MSFEKVVLRVMSCLTLVAGAGVLWLAVSDYLLLRKVQMDVHKAQCAIYKKVAAEHPEFKDQLQKELAACSTN